ARDLPRRKPQSCGVIRLAVSPEGNFPNIKPRGVMRNTMS
ncbi:MAG: hypothetical protein ACI853_001125, partial [Paracoccaceae bacterium]